MRSDGRVLGVARTSEFPVTNVLTEIPDASSCLLTGVITKNSFLEAYV